MDALNGIGILYYDAIFILISIIVILSSILVGKIKKIRTIEKKLSNASIDTIDIESFFDREIDRTSRIIERAKKSKKVYQLKGLNLRQDILNFEKEYLVEAGELPSNLKEINFRLVNYLHNPYVISAQENNTDEELYSKSDKDILKLGSKVATERKIIKEIRSKRLVNDGLVGELEVLSDQTDVGAIKNKIDDARKVYKDYQKNSVIYAEKRFALADGRDGASEGFDAEDLKDKIAEVKEKYNHSLKELQRLVENNNQKRKIIMKLESEIFKLKGDSGEGDEAGELIEKLKLQLRDSELCTATIEYEANSLRERLMDLEAYGNNKFVADNIENISGDIFSTLLSEGFVRVVDSSTPKQVIDVLIDVCGRMKLSMIIYSKDEKDRPWVSVKGKAGEDEKEFIRSMSDKDDKVWIDGNCGTAFKNGRSVFFIEDMFFNRSAEYLSLLSSLLIVAGGAIRRLKIQKQSDQQKDFLMSLTNKAKASIDMIDEQNKYLSDEVKNIVDDFIKNLNEFVENVPMTDIQDEMFRDLEHEFKTRVELLFVVGGTMDEAFVELINLLDSKMSN